MVIVQQYTLQRHICAVCSKTRISKLVGTMERVVFASQHPSVAFNPFQLILHHKTTFWNRQKKKFLWIRLCFLQLWCIIWCGTPFLFFSFGASCHCPAKEKKQNKTWLSWSSLLFSNFTWTKQIFILLGTEIFCQRQQNGYLMHKALCCYKTIYTKQMMLTKWNGSVRLTQRRHINWVRMCYFLAAVHPTKSTLSLKCA